MEYTMNEDDCCFSANNKRFRFRAAAIIVEDECVLFAGNEITANDVVSACGDKDSIKKVSVFGDIAKIGDSAFSGCTNLSEITFDGSLNEIGVNAFEN